MPNETVRVAVHSVGDTAILATVTRCGCGDPDNIHPGRICPSPRAEEDLGVISYNSPNVLRQRIWDIRKAYRDFRDARHKRVNGNG